VAGSTAFQRSKGKPYAETFRCPGGALCLDFCNSGQSTRGASGSEWIVGFPDLIDWLEAAEAVTGGQAARLRRAGAASPRAATQVWDRAIKFREALFRVLNAKAEGGTVAREDLSIIEAEHARAVSFARLSWTGERYAWSLDPSAAALEAAMQPLVESALSLLTSAQLERLRRCGNSTCYWLFIDETRNHSRRWCEMASCGNVVKVRRHRERARSAAH
jgi:predicted RNA-binding Zn ribbon-like protein